MKVFDRFNNHTIDIVQYKDLKIEEEINISSTLFFKVFKEQAIHFEEEGYVEIKYGRFVIKEKNLTNDGYEIVGKFDLEELLVSFEPKAYTTKQASFMLNDLLEPTEWTIEDLTTETRNRSVTGNEMTILEMVHNIITTFNYEMKFDNVNKKIIYSEELGSNKGTYFHNELNLKSLTTKSDTYDLITRLIPKGYDGLGIETVNNGVPYVENKTYTNKTITGYWNDERYQVKENLKDDAIKRLEKFSKPLRSYEIDIIDLTSKPEYEHLTFDVGDTITIVEKNEKIKEVQRIVKKTLYPEEFGNDKITIENRPRFLNEEQDKIIDDLNYNYKLTTAKLNLMNDRIQGVVETIEVTVQTIMDEMDFDSIIVSDEPPENPVINTIWLQGDVLYKWNGEEWVDIGKASQPIYDAIEENKTLIEQFDDRIEQSITKKVFNDYKDETTQLIEDAQQTFVSTAESWDLKFSKTTGSNKLKNSVGYSTTIIPETIYTDEELVIDYWETNGVVSTIQSSDLDGIGSGSAFILQGIMSQNVPVVSGEQYTLSLKVKNEEIGSVANLNIAIIDILGENNQVINKEDNVVINADEDFIDISLTFTAGSNTIMVYLDCPIVPIMVTNIMLNEGQYAHTWTPYPKELYTTNFKSDERGFRVIQIENGREVGYTEMTPTEFAGYYGEKKVFKMNREVFEMRNAKVEKEIQIGQFRFVAMSNGVGIVPVVLE